MECDQTKTPAQYLFQGSQEFCKLINHLVDEATGADFVNPSHGSIEPSHHLIQQWLCVREISPYLVVF